MLDIKTLESWLWDAACSIRGAVDAPKFKDYILPLIFIKRISDVFEDELKRLADEFGDEKTAYELAKKDHKLVRFFIPWSSTWPEIRKKTKNIGEELTDAIRAIAKENPKLQGVIDIVDFNAKVSGQRIIDDGKLSQLIEVISRHRIGLKDTEPDILGRAYEYLLRKFAEGQGQSAGEFYTPKEVGWIMAYILDPKQGQEVYDPACGSGGLLVKCQLALKEKEKKITRPLHLYGQEQNHVTYAMAKMNMFIHDMEGDIAIGDTLVSPKFLDGSALKKFDLVVANPMWNQDGYDTQFYEGDTFNRFDCGYPPASSADWGWVQHMFASLKENGRAAIVLDTNAVSRGSGSKGANREKEIRSKFVENGWIEMVILLPENLFYNTGAPGIIIILNKAVCSNRKMRLINASRLFAKGKPKNFIREDDLKEILNATNSKEDIDELCCILDIDSIRDIDYDLSPSRHVPIDPDIPLIPLKDSLNILMEIDNVCEKYISLRKDIASKIFKNKNIEKGMPNGWKQLPFEKIIKKKISGDWGCEKPEGVNEFMKCAVIRGTDFPKIALGKLSSIPYRFISIASYGKKKPQIGDMLIEISGGGKYQNTGRALFFDSELVEQSDPPLMFTNFTKLLRIDDNIVYPKYAYYFWMYLYDLGRTARYEKQPTNIKNFKFNDFLKNEQIVFPEDIERQKKIVDVLDNINKEITHVAHNITHLQGLRHSAMTELLKGESIIVEKKT